PRPAARPPARGPARRLWPGAHPGERARQGSADRTGRWVRAGEGIASRLTRRRRYTRPIGNLAGGGTLAKPYGGLTQPLVRDTKGGELRPATWDEALDRTVAGFKAAQAAHGPSTF